MINTILIHSRINTNIIKSFITKNPNTFFIYKLVIIMDISNKMKLKINKRKKLIIKNTASK